MGKGSYSGSIVYHLSIACATGGKKKKDHTQETDIQTVISFKNHVKDILNITNKTIKICNMNKHPEQTNKTHRDVSRR